MNLGMKSRLPKPVTVVANDFIDKYMAAANGEYVKVYLYLLRHEGEAVELSAVADALNHTEADVRRALSYWERAGVLGAEDETACTSDSYGAEEFSTHLSGFGRELQKAAGREENGGAASEGTAGARMQSKPSVTAPEKPPSFGAVSASQMERLSGDEEFTSLIYVVQQYLGKAFTPTDCEKFAYFYDVLHMSADLLEYLAEYCAGLGHTKIQYIEQVALNWHQLSITTRESAKDYTANFSRDITAVKKAFGITGRNLGADELKLVKQWVYTDGFDTVIVAEACARALKKTGKISFDYADGILSRWKAAGVKSLEDVKKADQSYEASRERNLADHPGNSRGNGRQTGIAGAKASHGENSSVRSGSNRFKNFEERNYDYDKMIWEEIRSRRKGGQKTDGAE